MQQTMTEKFLFSNVSSCTFNFNNGERTVVKPSSNDEIVMIKFISQKLRKNAFQEKVYANYLDVQDVPELASRCDYDCLKSFTRHFKKHFNSTPYQWMLERKMEEVRYLVLYSDFPIQEIAKMYNFKSPARLVNSYTSRYGVSPLRDRMQESRDAV